MKQIQKAVLLSLFLTTTCIHAGWKIPLNDTARYLAGITLPPSSPLYRSTRTAAYRRFKARVTRKWNHHYKNSAVPIRKWVKRWMPENRRDFLFYPFSGGDFINARLFFPEAKTILMIGLETAGRVPDITRMNPWRIRRGLELLDFGYKIFSFWNFYRTLGMRNFMNRSPFTGTLPHILSQMARAGVRPVAVHSVSVTAGGKLRFREIHDSRIRKKTAVDYIEKDGSRRRVIYLTLDLRNYNLKRQHGWRRYLQSLGKTDGFLKAASCLLPRWNYTMIRKIVLNTMTTIVTDDSGIPYRYLKKDWKITLFGKYIRAHYIFPSFSQPQLRLAYRTKKVAGPVPFPYTYERPGNRRNLQLCIKK